MVALESIYNKVLIDKGLDHVSPNDVKRFKTTAVYSYNKLLLVATIR